jgi:hypothetical protein
MRITQACGPWYGGDFMDEPNVTDKEGQGAAPRDRKPLTPAARRALAEAGERARRAEADPSRSREIDGRKGPEPTRFGDWERNGIISDF